MQWQDHYYHGWHADLSGLTPGGQHRLYYKSWGDVSAEDIVICVHGLTRNSHDFDDLAVDLVTHLSCRVIAVDIVGRGKSDWLASPQAYHIPQYCQDMHLLIEILQAQAQAGAESAGRNCRIHWVGTSMGGLIGMGLASQGVALQSLCLNDVGPFVPGRALMDIASSVADTPSRFPDLETASQWAETAWQDFGLETTAQWRKMSANMLVPDQDHQFKFHYDPQIMSLMQAAIDLETGIPDVDMWGWWQKISQPVFVFRGARSTLLTGDILAKMAEQSADLQSYICANTGHAPMLMKQAEIIALRNWLQSQISKKI